MNRVLIMLALMLSILSLSFIPQQPKQWEYKFDYKCNEKRTNEFTSQGWEFVAISDTTSGTVMITTCVFKRQK